MSTNTAVLNQAVAALGEPRSYFFNGRLLSAEDLRREQGLREGSQRRLARLLGCGVASGLQLQSLGGSKLRITAGLGLSPSGEVLEIEQLELDLSAAAQAGKSSGFANCAAGLGAGQPLAGVYLLVLTPAWTPQGRAQTLLGEVGACNRRTEQPAVRARLLEVQMPKGATELTLRNLLAVGLLSPGQGLSATGAGERVGWLPRQRQSSATGASVPTLGADDLPLAVLRIDGSAAVEFLDADSGRRRLAALPGQAADALWPRSWGVEMEAFAAQFLGELLDPLLDKRSAEQPDPTNPKTRASTEQAFEWLPPVLVLSRAQLTRWQQVFKKTALAPSSAVVVQRSAFARLLEDGLQDAPVPRIGAQLRLAQLEAHPERLLLRARAATSQEVAVGETGLFGRGERTSAEVASAAARIMSEGRKAKRGELEGQGPSKDELAVAASALTQTPNRARRVRVKPAPRK